MQYMLLIYNAERDYSKLPEAERNEMFDAYTSYTKELQAAGCFKAGDALKPIATATTVRVRGGTALTTDGPFAETKEQLGGYYLIECKSLDEALAWAARVPDAKNGSVEVRPVMEYPPPA